jgi:tetratricopeptide (TPR) repeat protein
VVIIHGHGGRNHGRPLRDRLHQWGRLTPEKERRVPRLLEIARISEQCLADPESALETYGMILELDPENAEARQGMNGLVLSITEPGLRLRWLRMELRNAAPERATELRLDIARIQEEDMDDPAAAVETLRGLVADTGPDGPGFVHLRRLLVKSQSWKDLVLLLQAKAEASSDRAAQRASLEEAIALFHEHLADGEDALRESLYRSMLRLEPGNREIAILLARLLRRTGRFEELCALLQARLEHGAPADRVADLYELAQVQALNLQRGPDAEASWQRILELRPDEEGALLALARAALQRGDLRGYIAFRQKQAKLLKPREAALVLCALAELCDESEGLAEMMVPFYREARAIDPGNVPAMEALKGIGRRLKNLRPAAALLPLDGERELPPAARARRLRKLGDDALDADPGQAVEWYHRATAIDPDDPENWQALAEGLARRSDSAGVYRSRLAWMRAFERTEPLDPAKLPAKAERLFQVAQAARAAGLEEVYATTVRQAFDLVPSHAAAALAAAQSMLEQDQVQEAHKLLHTILTQHKSELSQPQQVLAHFSRGLTLRTIGKPDQAMDDFREALRLQPLHADALVAMGEMQATTGRLAAALEHLIRGLVVAQDSRARGDLYYRLGVLWEDGLGAHDEAGACYELAVAEGLTHRDLLHRSLRHFQRSGRLDQSLEVVNGLLPTATDPEELATLWLVRGEIFAARSGRESEAIEAFDMALSYNPARQEARDGLATVLERREDWTQLLEVLEATCDVGSAAQQSAALLRMAEICNSKLGDPERAEDYLRRAVRVMPTRSALEQLEQVYTIESGRLEERKEILGLLVGFGPPWFGRAIELAKILLAADKSWAWCLISPLLGVSQVEPEMKAVVQAMRKEYERPPVLCCNPADVHLLRHPETRPELVEVLAELGERVQPLGVTSLDAAGDGAALAISEATTLGKTFAQMAEAMGLQGCTLYRTQELPESVAIVNAHPSPMVVVRTDVIQQLVHAEVGFLFAYALEQARPGHRVMAALPRDHRDQLLPALWLAMGFTDHAGKLAVKLAERIREGTDQATLAGWAERLAGLRGLEPVELGRVWWHGACATARRAGLLAGADLRQVFRVVSRLEAEVPRPRVVARLEELDDYISTSEVLQDLVAFAASPAFGQLIHSALQPLEG